MATSSPELSRNRFFKQRSRRPFLIIAGLFLLLIAGVALTLFIRFNSMPKGGFSFVASVQTAPVVVQNLPITYKTVGSLEASRQIDMNVETPGVIKALYFSEGDFVRKGAPLMRLDPDKQTADIQENRYGIVEAQASYSSLQADYEARTEEVRVAQAQKDLAQKEYDRYRNLWEKDYVSTQEVDRRQQDLQVAKARYAASVSNKSSALARLNQAKAGIGSAQARSVRAESQFSDTLLRAPFSGQIGQKLVELGDYVVPTEKILTLVQSSPLKITFQVPERYLGYLHAGQTVELKSESFPDRTFSGRVVFISPVVSTENRTILVKAHIDNPENQLRPGQYTDISLLLAEKPDALMVPEESLIPQGESYFVYVAEGGKAYFRPVKVGERIPGRVEILSGLTPSDRVVVGGIQKIQDKMPIKELSGSAATSDKTGGKKDKQ